MGFIKSVKKTTHDAGSSINKTIVQPVHVAATLQVIAPVQHVATVTSTVIQKQVIQPVVAPVQAVVLPVVKVVSEPTKTFAAVSKTVTSAGRDVITSTEQIAKSVIKPVQNFVSSSAQKTEKIASEGIEEITDSNNTPRILQYVAGGIGLLILANMIM
jgi:hypothetical protein